MTDTPTPHVLVVTSAGAPSSVVVPVLAAIEAAGMRVRAIDVGAAGGGGGGIADRMRRALLGESAERRLRKEMESNPPDCAIVFDPHAAIALTVARDEVGAASPVIAVVGEHEPAAQWGETAADRFCALDAAAAVALGDHGVEQERVLVVGTIGPRAWADAALLDRANVRERFKLVGQVAVIEVAGMGAELTSQIALQLSLAPISESTTFLFDAGADVEAAAMLRAKVPVLGLRAKLFGATADAPMLWRCAEVVVARPHAVSIAKAALIGARVVALVDDTVPGGAKVAAALETRQRAVVARSPLLIAAGVESLLRQRGPAPEPDGADTIADIAWVVARDRRGVVEERKAVERQEAHTKVRAATAAAQAAARVTAAPGELEDLGGNDQPPAAAPTLDDTAVARLLAETQARKRDLEKTMLQARAAAEQAQKQGDTGRADAERARMHGLLGELGQLETELKELERAVAAAKSGAATRARASEPIPPTSSVDDMLAQLKRQSAASGAPPPPQTPRSQASRPPAPTVDDELAALKRRMAQTRKKE